MAKRENVRRAATRAHSKWALAVHGGAGDEGEAGLAMQRESAIRGALDDVLAEGARQLASGGASLDAVEHAVRHLEDSPLFNAGKGAVFNARGEHELEASIMDGKSLRAGAVAGLRGVKNPVTLARLVMERTPHVFLQGEGSMSFARTQGVEFAAPEYFRTSERWEAFERERRRSAAAAPREHGTVGAVALDRHGNLAAATSTGGMTNKLEGRVGDSSIIGAGTYASNTSCAVSGTGHGEYFIRATVARDIAALIEYAGMDADAAAEQVIRQRLTGLGGTGGVIVVDREGSVVCVFNTSLMHRGFVSESMRAHVAIRNEGSQWL